MSIYFFYTQMCVCVRRPCMPLLYVQDFTILIWSAQIISCSCTNNVTELFTMYFLHTNTKWHIFPFWYSCLWLLATEPKKQHNWLDCEHGYITDVSVDISIPHQDTSITKVFQLQQEYGFQSHKNHYKYFICSAEKPEPLSQFDVLCLHRSRTEDTKPCDASARWSDPSTRLVKKYCIWKLWDMVCYTVYSV